MPELFVAVLIIICTVAIVKINVHNGFLSLFKDSFDEVSNCLIGIL